MNAKNLNKYHIFHNIWIYANSAVFKIQAMINIGTIYNLITKNLVKEDDISGDNKIPSLIAANNGKLRFYKQHQVAIKTYGHNGSWISDTITIYKSNIISCKLMLGMLWIRKTKPAFN